MPRIGLAQLRSRADLLGAALFLAGSAVLLLLLGIPQERDAISAWLLFGLLCFSLSDMRGFARAVVRDWLPSLALLVAYDWIRGSAKDLFPVHYLPQLRFDQSVFGGSTPTLTLRHVLWHGHPHWYDIALWGVYLTHFFATPLLAAVLWKSNRARFNRFVAVVAGLSFAGVATYALYPAAPPWMAARDGFLAPVTRIIPAVWHSLNLHSAGSVMESGYRYANDVAAVPSLHTAFAVIVAVTIWPSRRWLRPLVALYPSAMAFTLVYAGEHYLFDVMLGGLYAAGSIAAVSAVVRRRARGQASAVIADEELGWDRSPL